MAAHALTELQWLLGPDATDDTLWHDLRRLPWPLTGLQVSDEAAKEWIGLVAYRLAGHSDELFPAPRRP